MPIPIPNVTGWPQSPQNYLNPANVFDPMAGVFNSMAISKFQSEMDDRNMRRRIDEMILAETKKNMELERQTGEIGKKELMSLSPTAPVTPGSGQQDLMKNLLGPGYQPSIQARATAPTPQGPIDVANLQANPEAGARMLMAGRQQQQEQQVKSNQETLKDARTRVSSMIEKGNNESFQAYRDFLSKNPVTAPLAQELQGLKLTGGGKGEGQKFYSTEMLQALDPQGKLTDGTPGLYDFSFDGASKKLKKIKPDRDMLINSATNGTPAEKEWALKQMQGREQYEPITDFRSFRIGEMEKVKKEHPQWSTAEVESEIYKRYKKAQAQQQINIFQGKEEEKKKVWLPEVTKVVDAIEKGDQPPDLSGLSRKPEIIMQARTKMAEDGFDLSAANLDWIARKQWTKNVNGVQQLRLRQATSFASESLDIIEGLAREWDAGPYPILNKANLLLAKQGGLGPEAAKLATQLDTQISDLTSELGTVYKGGNSSTDESLKLAAQNLNSNWSKDVLLGNVELARKNLRIRLNTMKHTGPAGIASTSEELEAINAEYAAKRRIRKGGPVEDEKKPKYTQADLEFTAKKYKITIDEVKKKLGIK